MSRRKKVFLVAGLLLVAPAIAVVLWPGEREPEYQGRKLSEWIGKARFEIDPQNASGSAGPLTLVIDLKGRSREDVTTAVRHMGTNATQLMVRWLEYAPPNWRQTVVRYLRWMPQGMRSRADIWSVSYKGTCRALAAGHALAFMKPEEVPIEELRRISRDPNYGSRTFVTNIIALIERN